jgi:hypothetical protein
MNQSQPWDFIESSLVDEFLDGGGGIRTHEPLRDGITYFHLESCAFDRASLPLLDNARAYLPYFRVTSSINLYLFIYLCIWDANQSLECNNRFVITSGPWSHFLLIPKVKVIVTALIRLRVDISCRSLKSSLNFVRNVIQKRFMKLEKRRLLELDLFVLIVDNR